MIRSNLTKLISFDALMPFMVIITGLFVGFKMLGSKVPGFKTQKKKFMYYLLIELGSMAIIAAIVYNLVQSTLMLRYFVLLGYAFIAGGLHVFFFRKTFEKFESDKPLIEFLIALTVSVVLMVPIIFIASYFSDSVYLPYYALIIVAFSIPTLYYILFKYSVSIPVKLFSKWYYPLGKKYDSPKHYELNNMIVLNFMFHKNAREEEMTSFKAKAPKNMDFGRLFYFFINDYNEKKTSSKIEMTEDSGDPYGWYFYSKPKWYGASKHIDSELSVENNDLQDGDVVICQRI